MARADLEAARRRVRELEEQEEDDRRVVERDKRLAVFPLLEVCGECPKTIRRGHEGLIPRKDVLDSSELALQVMGEALESADHPSYLADHVRRVLSGECPACGERRS